MSARGTVAELASPVRLADSPEQLIDEVCRYLADPSHERAERKGLVRALCYRDDGQAGARVAEAIARIGARGSAVARWLKGAGADLTGNGHR